PVQPRALRYPAPEQGPRYSRRGTGRPDPRRVPERVVPPVRNVNGNRTRAREHQIGPAPPPALVIPGDEVQTPRVGRRRAGAAAGDDTDQEQSCQMTKPDPSQRPKGRQQQGELPTGALECRARPPSKPDVLEFDGLATQPLLPERPLEGRTPERGPGRIEREK